MTCGGGGMPINNNLNVNQNSLIANNSNISSQVENKKTLCPNPNSGLKEFQSLSNEFFPWAVTSDKRVVYINATIDKENVDGNPAHRIPVTDIQLSTYTKEVSIERRAECQTALADLALNSSKFCKEATDLVDKGILEYVDAHKDSVEFIKEIAMCMKKYMFSETGFGRIGEPKTAPDDTNQLFELCLTTLKDKDTPLPTRLAIHDFMGRIIFNKFQVTKGTDQQKEIFQQIGDKVRPPNIFGKSTDTPEKISRLRGRTARQEKRPATDLPGILSNRNINKSYQIRKRGIDEWQMKLQEMPAFTIDILQRNLIFGAGPSGSTGTLLQAAYLFGGELNQEHIKQYALAIVGYLVGGGMHSYHEVMDIVATTGCPYKTGAYIDSLPDSFKTSEEYDKWCANYYDIAVMGQKTWISDSVPKSPEKIDKETLEGMNKRLLNYLVREKALLHNQALIGAVS